ncbi:MAG TPA: hypothetical protein VFU23_14295, partial [Gemmatimonadales bacterium]|nr:hypothetical protein [Gemmatimonadales bacterium]
RAQAQVLRQPILTKSGTTQTTEITDLQRRVTALEAQLATMVGFTKDAYGNLSLRGNVNVNIDAGSNFIVKATSNMSLRAGGQADLAASGAMAVKGSTVALN